MRCWRRTLDRLRRAQEERRQFHLITSFFRAAPSRSERTAPWMSDRYRRYDRGGDWSNDRCGRCGAGRLSRLAMAGGAPCVERRHDAVEVTLVPTEVGHRAAHVIVRRYE